MVFLELQATHEIWYVSCRDLFPNICLIYSKFIGVTLFRRLDEAVLQARIQRRVHTQFSATFIAANSSRNGLKWLTSWSADPFNDDIPDPFREPEQEVTMKDVRRELHAEEAEEVRGGVVPEHSVSASKYLVAGFHLEDQQ